MRLSFLNQTAGKIKSDAIIFFFFEDKALFEKQKQAVLDLFPGTKAALDSGDFRGKRKSCTIAYTNQDGVTPRLIFSGLGEADQLSMERIRVAAAQAAKEAARFELKHCALYLSQLQNMLAFDVAQASVEGIVLSLYKFDKYISDEDERQFRLQKLTLFSDDKALLNAAKPGGQRALQYCEGVTVARDLANAPANEIYPETLAERVTQLGKSAGFKVTVLDKRKITSLKMHGLLAVNKGSSNPPAFIIMDYKGGRRNEAPVVLVGKGVTFDTGGISLKPAPGMAAMKADMHGAATVIGTMVAVAKAKLKVNIVALVPATDNMPSGSATLPGDIITYSNGTSVEVDNTDAEGRLILADALLYAARYKPQAVIDLATLTGACMVALGHVTSGMMGTSDILKQRLKTAAGRSNEYVCELPLYEEYEEQLRSSVADARNVGGRPAGSITAGLFLKHFTGDYPWVHLDIAGTAILPKASSYKPEGGSGVGVRLLAETLSTWEKM